MRRGHGDRHRWRVAAALVALLMVVAGCSSSKSTSSGGGTGTSASAGTSPSGGSAAPSGSPINVMTLASVNYAGPSYQNILVTAKLYQQWINAHGGIAGHPLNVTTCDEQGDPTKTAQCGRDAISNHDVAVIGSFTLNGNAIIPELAGAHISWFGICCAVASDELTSPDVQQIGSGLSLASGLAAKAAIDGCKKIALVLLNSGAAVNFTVTLVKNGLKSVNGPPLYKTVLVPLTAQDYSAQVADATSGSDCIIADLGQTNFPSFMPAFAASGAHQRLYGAQGNLDITVTSKYPQATQGAVIAGSYSDINLPEWADYRSAISQYHAPGSLNYNSLGGLGTWAAYVAFNQIVSKITGTITAANFLPLAQQAKVDLNGMAAPIDFSAKWNGLGGAFANAVNRTVTFDVAKNGTPVAFQNGKFYDMTNAMLGQPLAAADTPPAGS